MRKFAGVVLRTAAAVLWALLSTSFSTGIAVAQENGPLKGVALVIGQSAYEKLPALPNPERDAREIEDLLARLGFETELATNENGRKLARSIEAFIEDAGGADVALVYYSGHGIEAGGTNYLLPIDADEASLAAADSRLISLQAVLEQLRNKARITILLLDACRSNPYPREALVRRDGHSAGMPIAAAGLGAPRGAVIVESAQSLPDNIGEVIGFAAEPGQVALDGTEGASSPYAAALLKHLGANQGYDFAQMMTLVTEEVYLTTGTRQRPWVNASLRRFLSFGGKPLELTSDDALLVGERRKLLLSIAATPQDMRASVEGLARDMSLPLDPLYGMLRELQVDTTKGPGEIDAQLRSGAEALKKLLAEKVVSLRKDPELNRLAGLADRAQAEGAIALAKDYRAKASARADELDTTLDRREAEVMADRTEIASTYAEEAATAILAFDYLLASQKYEKAFEQLTGRDDRHAFLYRIEQIAALSQYGEFAGDNQALERAISVYEALGAGPKVEYSAPWALLQVDLSVSLTALGDRRGDAAMLAKAVKGLETALAILSRRNLANEWAVAQVNLGNALQSLSKLDGDRNLLVRSVAAYETALPELQKDSSRRHWSAAQNNLGNALKRLADRDGDTAPLIRAISAYETALSVRKRESMPFDWAETQYNLGIAMTLLGERKSDISHLRQAETAFEAVLAEWPRDRYPLLWASAQNSLAAALLSRDRLEASDDTVLKAISAYEAALTVTTRGTAPSQWAMLQNNLGQALATLGYRKHDANLLLRAIAAYNAALTERTRERSPLQWANTQTDLGSALRALGELQGDAVPLRLAIISTRAALNELERRRVPLDWAEAQNDLGLALWTLGQQQDSMIASMLAVVAFEAALSEWTYEHAPDEWAMAQNNLGMALQTLGARFGGTVLLAESVEAYEASLTVRTRDRAPLKWAATQADIGMAKLLLGYRSRNKSVVESGRKAVQTAWELHRAAGEKQYDDIFADRIKTFDTVLAALRKSAD
ncbi:caspase family protein [Aestuariivirga sp. YIM B02566]|uniref:Caspase family protein n=1 Tax=Taklimakanibacter albus TaxID=2800327 RepID=A0ACC5R062_9HYPH|nr:caspase family protein [Aestuariivirga sp. YIM B02566]MBK1865998.1 caspase family protein [Aestuariivirga sp. YIM B02566]